MQIHIFTHTCMCTYEHVYVASHCTTSLNIGHAPSFRYCEQSDFIPTIHSLTHISTYPFIHPSDVSEVITYKYFVSGSIANYWSQTYLASSAESRIPLFVNIGSRMLNILPIRQLFLFRFFFILFASKYFGNFNNTTHYKHCFRLYPYASRDDEGWVEYWVLVAWTLKFTQTHKYMWQIILTQSHTPRNICKDVLIIIY